MSETPTLQSLRKAKYKTIKQFAMAYGCSQSKASMILQGRYQTTLTKDEVVQLAALFEVPFDTCIAACNASYAEWKEKNNYPPMRESNVDSLKKRWAWEEKLRKDTEEAAKSGDWTHWRFTFGYSSSGASWGTSGSSHNHNSGSTHFYKSTTPLQSCYQLLGISQNATEAQIKQAFRQKVKQMHDGNGGYTGDMDELTKAKEQALKQLTARV